MCWCSNCSNLATGRCQSRGPERGSPADLPHLPLISLLTTSFTSSSCAPGGKAEVSGDFLPRLHLPLLYIPARLPLPHQRWSLATSTSVWPRCWCHRDLGSVFWLIRKMIPLAMVSFLPRGTDISSHKDCGTPQAQAGFPVSTSTLLALSLESRSLRCPLRSFVSPSASQIC